MWGLLQSGIRAIIAPSFAGIFFGNCEKNGLLAITLEDDLVDGLVHGLETAERPGLTIDLESCRIFAPDGAVLAFQVETARRRNLLEGRDPISETMELSTEIRRFEASHAEAMPWASRRAV